MKARRGDLVAVVTTVRDYVIGQPPSTEREQVTLGRVTSITREGVVRIAKYLDLGGTLYDAARSHDQVLVIPSDVVDSDVLVGAYCARRYPTAPDSKMVPPFGSVSECRKFIKELSV